MNNFLVNFHFTVEWGGAKLGFTKVRNLAMHYDIVDVRHAADPESGNHKVPAKQVFENFFLERTVWDSDNDFYDWWKSANDFSNPDGFRRDLTISLLNSQHEPIVIWKVKDAIPVRLSYSDLDAHSKGVMHEILEIACEGIQVENR